MEFGTRLGLEQDFERNIIVNQDRNRFCSVIVSSQSRFTYKQRSFDFYSKKIFSRIIFIDKSI